MSPSAQCQHIFTYYTCILFSEIKYVYYTYLIISYNVRSNYGHTATPAQNLINVSYVSDHLFELSCEETYRQGETLPQPTLVKITRAAKTDRFQPINQLIK